MRILLITFHFPPFNGIASVRTGKMASCLRRFGHDVRVLTVDDQPLPRELECEFPERYITRTTCLNVNRPVELALGGRGKVAKRGFVAPGGKRSVMGRLGSMYKVLLNFPDGQVGWLPYAIRAGNRLCQQWRPDVILASSPPTTVLHVAARLARRTGVPWVADFRDLGVDAHTYEHPGWRRAIEGRWEQRALQSAAGMVTVSQPLLERLARRYRQPLAIVMNGFDPADYPPFVERPRHDRLTIRYTGRVYPGSHDVACLCQGLALLGHDASRVVVEFFGRYLDDVPAIAERFGVSQQVKVYPPLPYRQSLTLQVEADALLLLLWNDHHQTGVYSGKLFEYLGARRPILAVGPRNNVAADLIRQRQAGNVASSPQTVAEQLCRWISELDGNGIPSLPASVSQGLTREDAARQMDQFLHRLVPGAEQLVDARRVA